MDTELPQLGEEIRPRYRCGVSPQYRHSHDRHRFIRHLCLHRPHHHCNQAQYPCKVTHTLQTLVLFFSHRQYTSLLKDHSVVCLWGFRPSYP